MAMCCCMTSGRLTSCKSIGNIRRRNSLARRAHPSSRQGHVMNDEGRLNQLQSCIAAQQFDRALLEELFKETKEMEGLSKDSGKANLLNGQVMATLFYEPSTRTRLSFEAAMVRLGGRVISTENASEFSSASKGESLEDTMRTIECYADVIVMRHSIAGSAKRAANALSIPLINAGDGPGQHPTQALLDTYTIQRELGHIDNAKVALVGDLANGRTVRSLAFMLSMFENVHFYFVSPEIVKMNDDVKNYLNERGVTWEEASDLADVAAEVDVLYQTRIQQERFAENPEAYEKARGRYIVDKHLLQHMKDSSVVMHPLPRLDEITTDVDADPRAAYFRQTKNGMFIRMALLKLLLVG